MIIMILTIQHQNHPPPHNNDDIKYKIITWMPPTLQRKPVSGSEELDRRFRAEKPDHRSDLRLLRKKYLDPWPCWHQLHLCLEGWPVLCTEVQEIAGLRPSAPSAPRGSGGRTRSRFRKRKTFSVNFAKKNSTWWNRSECLNLLPGSASSYSSIPGRRFDHYKRS